MNDPRGHRVVDHPPSADPVSDGEPWQQVLATATRVVVGGGTTVGPRDTPVPSPLL
jgi:hypothetical protein